MVAQIEVMGNPFLEKSHTLFALDTKAIMGENVIKALQSARTIGRTQFKQFVQERIQGVENKPITDTLVKNILSTF